MKFGNIYLVILCIGIGFLMGSFMLQQYNKEETNTVFSENTEIYFIQLGVYSSKESMEENVKDIAYYIYSEQDGQYYVYIGMTASESNKEKLSSYFHNIGYDTYAKKYEINNTAFLEILKQYDLMLENTNEGSTISAICSQVLGKYEELVLIDED